MCVRPPDEGLQGPHRDRWAVRPRASRGPGIRLKILLHLAQLPGPSKVRLCLGTRFGAFWAPVVKGSRNVSECSSRSLTQKKTWTSWESSIVRTYSN